MHFWTSVVVIICVCAGINAQEEVVVPAQPKVQALDEVNNAQTTSEVPAGSAGAQPILAASIPPPTSSPSEAPIDKTSIEDQGHNGNQHRHRFGQEKDHDGIGMNSLSLEPSFVHSFLLSFSMILISELGDKTFIIAALMAMRHDRCLVFGASIAALALMTVLSSILGYTFLTFLPHTYTHYASCVLFLFFGLKTWHEAYHMKKSETGVSKEMQEVETELTKEKDDDADLENQAEKKPPQSRLRLAIQIFSLVFLAEWGDRSQISTIALAAASHPFGVNMGCIAGHSITTAIAVIGGRMMATRISERTVAWCGGALFLTFFLHSLITGP